MSSSLSSSCCEFNTNNYLTLRTSWSCPLYDGRFGHSGYGNYFYKMYTWKLLPVVVSSEINAGYAYRIDFWNHLYNGGNTGFGRIGSGNPLGRKEPQSCNASTATLPVVNFLVVSYPLIGQFI